MRKIRTKIVLDGNVAMPEYKTKDSAGCDLVAQMEYPILLLPLDRAFIHTGVHIALPEGYEAQVRGRSGLNRENGIVVPTGTIDADFRGEICVMVYNLSRMPYTITPGDRIAQLIISPVIQAEWQQVDHLDKTDRGEGGFGSTGK